MAEPARTGLPAARGAELPIVRFDEATQGHFRFISGVAKERMIAIRSEEDWRVQWGLISARFATPPPAPEVNFENDMLLMAAMGSQGSGGYSVNIERALVEVDEVVAHVRFSSPGPRCGNLAVITSPADVVRVPKSEKNIRWEVERVTAQCG